MDIQDALSEIRRTLGEGVDPVLDWLQQEAEHYRLCCDPVSSENNQVTMCLRKSCASALTVLGGWCRLLDGKTLSFGGIGRITLPTEWQQLHYRIVEYYGNKTGLIVPPDALSARLNDPEDRYLHQRDFFLLREAYHALIHGGISFTLEGAQGWIFCKHGVVVEVGTLRKALLLLANPHTTVVHVLPDNVRRPPTHHWLLHEQAVLIPRSQ